MKPNFILVSECGGYHGCFDEDKISLFVGIVAIFRIKWK